MLRAGPSILVCLAIGAAGCGGGSPPLGVGGAVGNTSGAAGSGGRGGARPPLNPDGGGPVPDGEVPEEPPLGDGETMPGPAPLRRLTITEYNNTVRDLVGGTLPTFTRARLGFDQTGWWPSGFARGASPANGDDARGLMLAGEELAPAVRQRLPVLLPCSAALATPAEEESCADAFIDGFSLRAFRRPLQTREKDKLHALYTVLRGPEGGDSFAEAIGDLATAMVQSPEFLYRRELAPGTLIKDGSLVRFNGYELASRLSYLFWASMPDDQLLQAARDGQLNLPAQLAREARRLLADGRARDGIESFHEQWLEIGDLPDLIKDAGVYKEYTPQLARTMMAESRAFAASVFLGPQADGKLETLLKGTASFVDAPLARLYGVAEPAGPGLQPVFLPAGQRAGIFTRAAFLASTGDAYASNPVDRGATLLRRLLCVDLMEPSDLVIPALPEPRPSQTTRERFEAHGMVPCASACHEKIIDPLGYAFENYGAIGEWRDTDNGKPVNARASAPIGNTQREFKDAIELMDILAHSDEVRTCMTTQWLRYLLGRQELSGESPSVKALDQLFRKSGDDLRELIVGLVRTRTFTHRTLSPGEQP